MVTVATDCAPPMPTVGYLMAPPGIEDTPEGTGARGMVMAGFTCLVGKENIYISTDGFSYRK